MDLRQIRYFLQVAEMGSFSRAAQALAVAQSALSRQVALLEGELGAALLVRNGRGVEPTEAGQRFADHCRAILQQVEHARADLAAHRDQPSGHLMLGMPPSAGRVLAMPVVGAFRSAFPQATISIVEGLSADLIERLHAGRIDIALVYEPPKSASLRIVPLARQELYLVAPAAAKSRGRRKIAAQRDEDIFGEAMRLADISKLPLIMPGRAHAMRRHIEAEMIRAKVAVNVACEIDGIPALLELVAQGLGHAILPLQAIALHDRPRFLLHPIAPSLSITLAAVAPSHRPANALTRASLALLQEVVPQALVPDAGAEGRKTRS